MKKLVWWAWLIGPLVPVLIFVVVAFALQPEREEQTVAQFEADRTTLEQLALQVLEQGSTWEIEPPDHWQGMNLYRGECPSVEFEFRASGFASETTYWGVTYVPCDHTMYMKYFHLIFFCSLSITFSAINIIHSYNPQLNRFHNKFYYVS